MKHITYILLAVFVAYFAFVFSSTVDPKLDLNGDNAHYIQLARNIADGHGYAAVRPDGTTLLASHFPPGYSAILSVFITLGFDTLMSFKVINGIFLLFSLIGLSFLTWKLTGQRYLVLAISALTILSPQLMHFAGIVMSEMSYLLATMLSILSLYLYDRYKGEKKFYTSPWFYTAILFAVGAYYIRTVGASIMFALVVFYLFRKEWLASVASIVSMFLLLLPWSMRNAAAGVESRYLGMIMTVNPWRPEDGNVETVGDMIEKMIVNVDETVIKGFKEILFPFIELNYNESSGIVAILGGVVIIAIMIWGAWNLKTFRWMMIAFFAANIGLFALWHGGNGSRYVVPIAPFIYTLFYVGVYFLVKTLMKDRLKQDSLCGLLPLVMMLPMYGPIKMQHDIVAQPYHPAYINYFAIAEQMEEGAKGTYVVSSRKPELFKIYAPSMFTTRYLYDKNPDKVVIDMIDRNVDFVVLDQLGYSSTALYLYPAIQKHIDLFHLAAHLPNPDTYLFRFDKEKAKAKLLSK